MADPSFPFEIGRREGRLTRPIMCRRCATWTAFDGTRWRHPDGTDACVQPDAIHNQQPSKETNMTTKTKKPATKKPATVPLAQANITVRHHDVPPAIVTPTKKMPELVAPKGLTKAQQAEFARNKARREANAIKSIPSEFQTACELVPQVGMPFASPNDRTKLANLYQRATAYAKTAGIAPEAIDLIASYNNYINHTNTESRKPAMNTTKGNTKTVKGTNGSSAAITEAEIDAFVTKHEASGAKMTKGAIVDAIRASGAKIGYPGGDYLVALLAKRPKTAKPAEKPQAVTPKPAATKPAAKGAKSAEGNLTRKTVTPIPKKKAAAKSATNRKATAKVRKS